MLDDFTPIMHDLPGRTIKVYPVADVHIGAREADVDGFSQFLKRISQDDDSYLAICGDILNNGLKDSMTNVYEETMPPSEQVKLAAELLKPVADKILGCVSGNHELRSKRMADYDPLASVMTLIDKPELYRPNMAFVRVRMREKGSQETYTLLLVHGKTANKKKQFQYAVEGVDAVISGHTHDGIVEKPARLVFTQKGIIRVKHIVSVTATSWLNYGGYAASGLMLPKATGDPQCLVLEFTRGNRKDGHIRVAW